MDTPPNLTPESWARAEAIFDAAVRLPAAERGGYLDRACSGDSELRRCVDELLKAHDAAGGFLDEPAVPVRQRTIVVNLPIEEQPGDRIGRYKLLQKLGEGGCGVVYMAEQEEPVRRRVESLAQPVRRLACGDPHFSGKRKGCLNWSVSSSCLLRPLFATLSFAFPALACRAFFIWPLAADVRSVPPIRIATEFSQEPRWHRTTFQPWFAGSWS